MNWSALLLFFMLVVDILTSIILVYATKKLTGWKRTGAGILSVFSIISTILVGIALLVSLVNPW